MLLSRFLLCCIVLGLPRLTFAQTVFDVSGAFAAGQQLTGTVTINTVTGYVINWDVVVPDLGPVPGYTFTPSDSQRFGLSFVAFNAGPTINMPLGFPNLVDFNGGAFVNGFYLGPAVTLNGPTLNYVSGEVTPVVPEPSTLILMGSGLVGMLGFRRKLFGIGRSWRPLS